MSNENLSKDKDHQLQENEAQTLRFTKDHIQQFREGEELATTYLNQETGTQDADSLLSDDVLRDAGYVTQETAEKPGSRVERHQRQPGFIKNIQQSIKDWEDKMTKRFFRHETGQYEEEEVTDQSIPKPHERVTNHPMDQQSAIASDQEVEDTMMVDDFEQQLESTVEITEDSDQFVKGAAWMTAGNIFSRLLGALYIVPWATWLGAEYTQANTLFSIGYKPYSLFLAVATAGFPSAIAKQMAYYHSHQEYRVADKLFKYSIIIMGLTGLAAAGLLYWMAPALGIYSATDNPEGAILVIRSLVPALLILPIMSLLRGYFQGFNDMVPTAVSQILEQVARVIYLLTATYAIMQLYSGNVTQAVVHSTFAAFIGAFVSLLYLLIVYFRQLPQVKKMIQQSHNHIQINFKKSIRIMIVDSIPFIILGSGIIIAQMIDAYTFRQILQNTTLLRIREISELYGAMSLDVDKLIMIIISLAIAISASAIPAITGLYASGKRQETRALFEHIVLLFSFIMFPAALGLASISDNIYYLFYPAGHELGPSLLILAAISSIVLGAYTILSTVLQSMNFRRAAVKYLLIGLIVKLVLQIPLIAFLQTHGAILTTMIGFLVSSILMWRRLRKALNLTFKNIKVPLREIIFSSLAMSAGAFYLNRLLNIAIESDNRGMLLLKVLMVVSFAGVIYGGLMAVLGHWHILVGDRFKDLQEKMRFK